MLSLFIQIFQNLFQYTQKDLIKKNMTRKTFNYCKFCSKQMKYCECDPILPNDQVFYNEFG